MSDDMPRVLGVDDSLTIRKALELVLRPAGYRLELAANGTEAVEKAREFKPEVMLLDFILPDMPGTEVCKRLAADPETAAIPVVLISAKGAEIRQAYQDVGNVVSYITKPFTPDVVTGVVADVLEKVRSGELLKPVPEAAPAVEAEVEAAPAVEAEAPVEAEAAVEPGEAWEEVEEELLEPVAPAGDEAFEQARRDALEILFENLRAGLEGVYVEELENRAGIGELRESFGELVSQLAGQVAETLHQARVGIRYALNRDGSLRSLDEAFMGAYRRMCRLLFRAVAVGAVRSEAPGPRPRMLLVCRPDSPLRETFAVVAATDVSGDAFVVCERYRQLPHLVRLLGPTHVLVEATGRGAIVDQLRTVMRMPESRRVHFVAVRRRDTDARAVEVMQQLGVAEVVDDGPGLLEEVRRWVEGARPVSVRVADSGEGLAAAGG